MMQRCPKSQPKVSVVAVARDSRGMFIGASAIVMEGISDPEIMEVVAVKEGLALASNLSMQRLRLASDNINVIRSLLGAGLGRYGHIVQETKAREAEFSVVDFVHEGRLTNGDAHREARSVIYDSLGRHLWLLFPPDCL